MYNSKATIWEVPRMKSGSDPCFKARDRTIWSWDNLFQLQQIIRAQNREIL